jgi:hypothetical protein
MTKSYATFRLPAIQKNVHVLSYKEIILKA